MNRKYDRISQIRRAQGRPVACRHAAVAKRLVPTVRPTYHSHSLRETDL
jgi:hypothetical protein